MKRLARFAVLVAMVLVIAGPAFAQDATRSFVDKITGGSLVVTNNVAGGMEKGSAFQLKSLMYTDPVVGGTNYLTIQQVRRFQLPDVKTTSTETNILFAGRVTTNTVYYSGGLATFTNSITIGEAVTNTAVTQQYDEDDFGKGWVFEPNDVTTFTFSGSSSTIYLIRVYDVYPRP